MAFMGKLKDIHIGKLLILSHVAQKTGLLVLQRTDELIELYFKEGYLIYAQDRKYTKDLANLLFQAGKLNQKQLDRLRHHPSINNDMELGLFLVNANLLSQQEILGCIYDHVIQVIKGLFNWTDGTFSFVGEATPSTTTITIQINVKSVIKENALSPKTLK